MRRFSPSEIETFLFAVDDALEDRARLTVIGGSALTLGYAVEVFTNDIDTYSSDLERVNRAAAVARKKSELPIPLANSSIAQVPSGFEQRLKRVLPSLQRLEVWVLDPYDLAVSKLLRGDEHDRQQLVALHEQVQFDKTALVSRFMELMADYVGDPTEPRWALFHFVDELWGELAALPFKP